MTQSQIKTLKNARRSLTMLIARVGTAKLIPEDVMKIHERHSTQLKELIECLEYPELHAKKAEESVPSDKNHTWED
jgi:hypothetical protein